MTWRGGGRSCLGFASKSITDSIPTKEAPRWRIFSEDPHSCSSITLCLGLTTRRGVRTARRLPTGSTAAPPTSPTTTSCSGQCRARRSRSCRRTSGGWVGVSRGRPRRAAISIMTSMSHSPRNSSARETSNTPTRLTRAAWTGCGLLTSGSTARPKDATRRVSGFAVTTNTTKARQKIAALEGQTELWRSNCIIRIQPVAMTPRCRLNSSPSVALRLSPAWRRQFISVARCVAKWNAWRLDDVHDVDANARSDLVGISHEFPAHVVVNDGGHDASLGAAHVFENKTRPGLVVCDGHRILRRLAGERHGNLCARCRIRSGGHAVGSFQPRRPCDVRRVVDCCRGLSIYKLENHRAAPLPFAIRVRKCLPGTRNQLPPWLQARHGLLPLLRRP